MIDLQNTGAGLDGYGLLAAQLEALLADERDFIANAAQFSAFLYTQLDDLNWAGFTSIVTKNWCWGRFKGRSPVYASLWPRRLRGGRAESANPARPGRSRISRTYCLRQCIEQRVGSAIDQGGASDRCAGPDSPSVGRFNEEDQAGIERLAAIFLASTDC